MNTPADSPLPTDAGGPLPAQEPPGRPFPVWSGWDIWLLAGFAVFTLLIINTVWHASSHLLQTKFPLVEQALRHPASGGVLALLAQALLDGLMLGYIFLTIRLKYSSPFCASIKLERRPDLPLRSFSLLGVTLALVVLGISALAPSPSTPPIEHLLRFPVTMIFYAALGILLAPFVEEVLFRGFIYPIVERRAAILLAVFFPSTAGQNRLPPHAAQAVAVLTTALLFTLMHVGQLWGSWVEIALILMVGLTLSTVRARTGSLVPSFIIHLTYNSSISLAVLVQTLLVGSQP